MTKKNMIHALSLADPRRQDLCRSNELIELAALMIFDRRPPGPKRPMSKADKHSRAQRRGERCIWAIGGVPNDPNTT
jgi:hypothetical protein